VAVTANIALHSTSATVAVDRGVAGHSITSTFLIIGPDWKPSLGGGPALSPAGGS
jgi:hypothetical protein